MAHNGGKLQVGPWAIQYGGYFPFINHLKTAQNWAHNLTSTLPAPNEMDLNGYPSAASGTATWTTSGGVFTVFGIPNQADRPGQYVVKWTGDGTISLAGATVASGSLTGNNGRAVVNITGAADSFKKRQTQINFRITGRGASSYISHAAFVHIDDEAAYDAGQVFGDKFKEKLLEGGFGVIRFLDWMGGSSSTHAKLVDEKPIGNFSYEGGSYRADLYAGPTSNVGDAYSLPAPSNWSGLQDKARVVGKFNASAVGNSQTLSVAGTAPKPLLAWLHLGPCAEEYTKPFANIYFTAIYDALLDGWILKGGADPSQGGDHGNAVHSIVHMSLMVRLCNEVGAHPWFTIPPFALDPLTDYPAALATYCKNNLDAGLIPFFEPANEVWNNAGGFVATRYGWAKEKLRNGGVDFDENNWYGRVLSKMGQAVSAVYGNDRSKYRVICGVQTRNTNAPNARLTSANLAAETGNPNDAAKFWTTHVAHTGYWNSTYTFTQELAVAQEYQTANAARQAKILADYATSNTLTSDAANYAYWKSWAAGFGVNGLCQYEGGYSQDYLGGNLVNNGVMATKAAQAALTLTTSTQIPPVGMSVKIDGTDGMTELNGNTYPVVGVTGSDITLGVNSTGFGTWYSATITNITKALQAVVTLAAGSTTPTVGRLVRFTGVNGMTQINGAIAEVLSVSGLDVTVKVDTRTSSTYTSGGTVASCPTVEIINSKTLLNGFRETSKNCPELVRQTLRNWQNLMNVGGEFPSVYVLSGPNNAWSVLDPTIYVSDPPQWEAAKLFNAGKRRFRAT